MNKPKAILIIFPIVGPKTAHKHWSEAGYKTIVLYPPINELSDYFTKGLLETNFDVKLFDTGDFDKDLELLREQQEQYDIVYGYIGCETGIPYSEKILHALFPGKSNDPKTSLWRYSKYAMNERLHDCHLPYIKQCRILQQNLTPEVENFLAQASYPIVIKPSFNSAGSHHVYFCNSASEVQSRMQEIGEKGIYGPITEIIVQEKISGIEFLVDAFTFEGTHKISTVLKYEKFILNQTPVYRAIINVDPNSALYTQIAEAVKKTLTALGVDYGFSHTEVMLTPDNEIKLIELNLRPSGVGGFINDTIYYHHKINQFTLAIDSLKQTVTPLVTDEETYCLFLLNNLGFTYKKINTDILKNISSFRSIRILQETCETKPEKTLLTDTVAILHLANTSSEKLHEDMDLLSEYESKGTLFEN